VAPAVVETAKPSDPPASAAAYSVWPGPPSIATSLTPANGSETGAEYDAPPLLLTATAATPLQIMATARSESAVTAAFRPWKELFVAQFVSAPFTATGGAPCAIAVQAPLTHACVSAQALPQAPQFARSSVMFTHAPEQFVCPLGQVRLHMPSVHASPAGQTVPQLPQLLVSLLKFEQNAVAPAPHALGVATGHAQEPPPHCWPAGQVLPHDPQSFTSVDVLVQNVGLTVGQAVWPATHETEQDPAVQRSPAAHLFPQTPQLFGSVWKAVQNALPPVPHAFGVELGQEQPPPAHCCPAAHVTPQEPQSFGSVEVLVQNVGAAVGQAVCPETHESAHEPDAQSWPAGHTVPQVPQLLLSVCELAQ
jgi:hypothetical protein